MRFQNVLITGGAGFVGSHLALRLRDDYPNLQITCLDNLKRRGSESKLPLLREAGIRFMHGDIRAPEDLVGFEEADLILECSAEPSVLAGLDGNPGYVVNSNLVGTTHCLELARRADAAVLFLSTSRIYPYKLLDALAVTELDSRFDLLDEQSVPGASAKGIAEDLPLGGPRSLYGATKLASELLVEEYREAFGIPAIINRFGVITGPGQMGKVDQGVFVFWLARHFFGGELSYIGYGGSGKQVRDLLHVEDCYSAIQAQLEDFDRYDGEIFNIGGGRAVSLSLCELTEVCVELTGRQIPITSVLENRPADTRLYITDTSRFRKATGWAPAHGTGAVMEDIYEWMRQSADVLKPILV